MNPIWKDYTTGFGNTTPVSFRVLVGNDVVYQGRADKRPGASENSIRINDILADRLSQVLPALTSGTYTQGGEIAWILEMWNGSEWDEVSYDSFLADWSYDRTFNPSAGSCISFPINRRADIRQTFLFSFYQATGNVTITEDYGDDTGEDFEFTAQGTGTLAYKANNSTKAVYGSASAMYNIVPGCHDFVLHYVNSYGGWDSFLIEGNTQEADSLERSTRQMEYDNRTATAKGKENYLTEIVKGFTFHTGYLTDAESLRMPHLLNSTEVYLENLADGSIVPVILTNTSTEYKTYKNTGAMVNYEIAVEVAHNYIRR